MTLAERVRRLSSGYQGMDDQASIARDVEELERKLSDTKDALKHACIARDEANYLLKELERKLKVAVEALRFYSDKDKWNTRFIAASCGCCSMEEEAEINYEYGQRARAALEEINTQSRMKQE